MVVSLYSKNLPTSAQKGGICLQKSQNTAGQKYFQSSSSSRTYAMIFTIKSTEGGQLPTISLGFWRNRAKSMFIVCFYTL